MELKPYQQQVIDDLSNFLKYYDRYQPPEAAYNSFWEEQLGSYDREQGRGMPPYRKRAYNKPHVCIKVPTAGGKTYIACNALKPIFESLTATPCNAVVWLVPTNSILQQTIENLSNPNHPYRKRIDSHFQHRAEVFAKEELLNGRGFNPTSVREQLSIMVMSFDSFRSAKKEDRKIYQENGRLAAFVKNPAGKVNDLKEHDPSSLINVIRQLHPVVIVDESHNAGTVLSYEMIENLNPRFVLELTATPREGSNIISFVDAFALKKEHMIKLPVIVYNHHDKTDVIHSALQLRQRLENKASAEHKNGAKYIRPIILFQAQSKGKEEHTTFEKIKANLLALAIPEAQIAIKTATINELRGVDLMSEDCEIRYIITVNALKEGWDCPFAYILASLADRSSDVDVEQILGRVLRQPFARKHNEPLLNLSYVLTASSKFKATLDNITSGLNRAGFSDKDYYASDQSEPDKNNAFEQLISTSEKSEIGEDTIEVARIMSAMDDKESKPSSAVAEIESNAIASQDAYDQEADLVARTGNAFSSKFLKENSTHYNIKDIFRETASAIKIPQLFVPQPPLPLFEQEFPWEKLHKSKLLEEFPLSQADSQITIGQIESPMYKLDLEATGKEEYQLSRQRIKGQLFEAFSEQLRTMSEENQRDRLGEVMYKIVKDYRSIDDTEIRSYITRAISQLDATTLVDVLGRHYEYKKLLENKIDKESTDFAYKVFFDWCDTDKISAQPSYEFPEFIIPVKTAPSITKSLYKKEGRLNGFEEQVIERVANLENVLFWHRILERKPNSFHINGFVNHYPDFVVATKKGTIIMLEAKGDDRDNSDSKRKVRLGKTWAQLAGPNYKYMMTFENRRLEDAWPLEETLNKVSQL